MYWIFGLFLFFGALVLLVLRAMKGPVHTLESIRQGISDLLLRGFNDGFLLIDMAGKKYFLQLRKYVRQSGEYGIELAFPNATWSSPFFKKTIALCDEYEQIYVLEREKMDKSEMEFLYVDFGKDVDRAHCFVKQVFLEVFDVEEDVRLFVRLENARLK